MWHKRSLVQHLVLGSGPVHCPLETGLELELILIMKSLSELSWLAWSLELFGEHSFDRLARLMLEHLFYFASLC